MFDVRKDFYTAKACQLLDQYEEKGYHQRAKFVRELIETQAIFGSKSIVGCELLLNGYYRDKTIKAALFDLNYSLVKLRRRTDRSFFDFPITQHTIVAFAYAGGN